MLAYELSQAIESQLRMLGIKYEAKSQAPDTFALLKSSCTESKLTIWDGASDQTIYGDPKVNHAFRAWHDALHLKLNAPFTLQGEIYVAKAQASAIGDTLGKVIMAEVQGQAEYFAKHGEFPVNQVEFILNYIKGDKP